MHEVLACFFDATIAQRTKVTQQR